MDKNLLKKIDEKRESVNSEAAASILDISSATIRNWIKANYLVPCLDKNKKYVFYKEDIENLKTKIIAGNFNKLNNRANKLKAKRTFLPEEYIKDKNNFAKLNLIINFVKANKTDLSVALFLLSVNLLKKEKIITTIALEDLVQQKDFSSTNKQLKEEIREWLTEINSKDIKENYSYLLNCDLPPQEDILGVLYQSLLMEGEKSKNGAYYSPPKIVAKMVKENIKKQQKVLDLCCGTGQFLLAFAEVIENPLNIYGIDLDPLAVKIARINLLLKYKKIAFVPNIICRDSLLKKDNNLTIIDFEETEKFAVVGTNPPWGVHFSKNDAKKLGKHYPEIKSGESFSYFLVKSHKILEEGGTISFILPESILNVKSHADIRKFILDNFQIKKVELLGRPFKNVFTPVLRLDLEKSEAFDNNILIINNGEEYKIKQAQWRQNKDYIFNTGAKELDNEIIAKIYKQKHTTLEGKADWALGLVTGNNKKFLVKKAETGYEPIYTGGDIKKFIFKEPSHYINFEPEKFQQVAPVEKYRVKEKLVYKFISKYLVFAYDDGKKLSLNSANLVIPKIPAYPIKVIAALLNSSLYQFIFQKKFGSIKVLRNHLEQLPLPLWNKKTYAKIVKLVDATIKDKNEYKKLDNYILAKCLLSKEEKTYIIKYWRK